MLRPAIRSTQPLLCASDRPCSFFNTFNRNEDIKGKPSMLSECLSHSVSENEYFFVDPDLKLTKVAPEGWKEEPKRKGKAAVDFTLFFRIKFFMDDVSLIQ